MKKIFTLMASLAVGLSAMAVNGPFKVENKEVTPNPLRLAEIRSEMNSEFNHINATEVESNDEMYTRSWTDSKGNVWILQIELYKDFVGDYFGLTYNDGTKPTIDDLPYFPAFYMLRKLNATQDQVLDGVMFYLCWPTKYLYSQIFEWEGPWEEVDGYKDIPADDRDFSPVTLNELANNANGCRLFTETKAGYFDGSLDKATGYWSTWAIVNCEWMGITSMYNGSSTYATVVTDSRASTVSFSYYDKEEDSVGANNIIYMQNTNTNATVTLNADFNGLAEVEGFEARTVVTPDFGDIHVFNAGLISSEELDLDNPFSEQFDPVTAFYVVGGDPVYEWIIDPSAKAFAANKIGIKATGDVPTSQANVIAGYAFADEKYGSDITLDPTEMRFDIVLPVAVQDPTGAYLSIAPAPNKFVPTGYNYEWSKEWGFECDNLGQIQSYTENAHFAWGTVDGFEMTVVTPLSRTIYSKSTGKIIYHYDPTDMQKTREFSAVGTAPSAVKGVQAQNGVNVIARDGMINVVAGENAPIAIFTLDGKLVKATKASEVSVEAPKGMYVVRVGNKAKKVVL